jgi:hypothetical protein
VNNLVLNVISKEEYTPTSPPFHLLKLDFFIPTNAIAYNPIHELFVNDSSIECHFQRTFVSEFVPMPLAKAKKLVKKRGRHRNS